ncbi:hypothetical protein N7468_002657 [Penicillium chermesinum]|uniref:Uncharacterized protein n=1 Tax=Penicillium chermesinum TaxID=63820 RepID=A0A9W9TZT4_9EURO|nr:uncharacterized protein N7468_002657 [Penicillium chermesinum]KAJ5247674.1 hypothetical protein N7468_002657 [Penicillium chermesinum]
MPSYDFLLTYKQWTRTSRTALTQRRLGRPALFSILELSFSPEFDQVEFCDCQSLDRAGMGELTETSSGFLVALGGWVENGH